MRTRRFKLTPVVPTENELAETVAAFLRKCVLPPAECNIFPAGHVQLTPAQAAKLSRLGLNRGWP